MNFITRPFASLLISFYDLTGSYGWAILLFGLVVKLIMLPFQAKSTHASMRQSMLQPRQKDLERKYGNDKNKYSEELNKLYKDAKVNPLSGCLWSLLPFPILIALYALVRQPLSKLMGLAVDEITTLTTTLTNMGLYVAPAKADVYGEMTLANILTKNFDKVVSNPAVVDFADKLKAFNFEFCGMNMTDKPKLFFWNYFDQFGKLAAVLLFLLPILSAFFSWLQMKISSASTPKPDPKDEQAVAQAKSAQSMNTFMPLMSVYICFIMPAAMGIYWIEQSILGIFQSIALNKYFKKSIDEEMREFNEAQAKKDAELAAKRAETERLKAEGKMQQNVNTSKKRIERKERNDAEQDAAARRAAERAALGLEKELPASQVGNRRYARGRAYEENRFERMEAEALERERLAREQEEQRLADNVAARYSRGHAYDPNRYANETQETAVSVEEENDQNS